MITTKVAFNTRNRHIELAFDEVSGRPALMNRAVEILDNICSPLEDSDYLAAVCISLEAAVFGVASRTTTDTLDEMFDFFCRHRDEFGVAEIDSIDVESYFTSIATNAFVENITFFTNVEGHYEFHIDGCVLKHLDGLPGFQGSVLDTIFDDLHTAIVESDVDLDRKEKDLAALGKARKETIGLNKNFINHIVVTTEVSVGV